ncbi:VOC family protein [Streptomyces sp. B1866]|uniref:VOC family protein n=1 Tax=Streptomyces sp. B1866 TaxID=3075431 RepID=UPI00288F41CE|nr:VOC family protein [Streptomyces sp. B1866]MDT3395858.1 VOC family protein [Streptomyces sp. B1866]
MPIATLSVIVLDCPDPTGLARFYERLLGGEIKDDGEDWVDLYLPGGQRLAFQRAENLVPPRWPREDASQQLHLDLDVPDVAEAEERVLAFGARPLDVDDDGGRRDFRVYADPAGHPFCLVKA